MRSENQFEGDSRVSALRGVMTESLRPTQLKQGVELLRASYLFRELSDHLLEQVAAVLGYQTIPANSWIFQQGDPGDSLYLLSSGCVEIRKQPPSGPEIVLTLLEAPAAFGEIALLNGDSRSAGVFTLSETAVSYLSSADFHRLMSQLPEFALALARTMASRIVALSDQVPVPVESPPPAPEDPGEPPLIQPLETSLPAGWSSFADPLNSRVLKLNEAIEPVWLLDTSLIQVFRPIQVAWPDAGRFVVLDGESSKVSCWNERAQLEWELDGQELQWQRMVLLAASPARELLSGPESLALLLLDGSGLSLRRPDGKLLWSSQAFGLSGIRDFAVTPAGELWLLQAQGLLTRYDLREGMLEKVQLNGSPNLIALAADGALAVYQSQSQQLQLLKGSARQTIALEFSSESPQFRISDPLGLFWADQGKLCLYDQYRLLQFDDQGRWLQRSLLQALPQHHNLAPIGNFMARARRETPLQGSSQLRLNELLQRVPLFARAPEALLEAVGRRIRTLVFNRGDLIVKQGEPGSSLFMIRQGQAQVLDDNQTDVVATMGPGNLFGEVSLMLGSPRNASIRAASYCELLSLMRSDLDALVGDWPELGQRLLQLAQERQTQQQLRSDLEQRRLEIREQAAAPEAEKAGAADEVSPLQLWVRDTDHGRLALINRNGELLKLLDDEVGLMQPVAVFENAAGLWVLDPGLAELQLLDPASLRLRRCFQSWGEHSLDQPWDLVPDGEAGFWLLNAGKGQLLHLDPTGELIQALRLGRFPTSLQLLPNGHFLIADLRQHTISEFTPTGHEIWRYGSPRRYGRDENLLFAPEYAERLDNGHVLIADTGNSRIIEVTLDGRIVWSLLSATGLMLQRPSRCRRLSDGHTLIEHNRRRSWLEVNSQLQEVWQYTVPEQGE